MSRQPGIEWLANWLEHDPARTWRYLHTRIGVLLEITWPVRNRDGRIVARRGANTQGPATEIAARVASRAFTEICG